MVLIIETIVEVLKACVSPEALFILALMILIVYIFKAGTNYLNTQIAITSWTRRGKNLGHGWSRRIYP